ncbi:MAG: helix-turn-helix transcriptional regulator [Chloroflexaceae bacterium]|nr:helix-turn-helix transcriptional regulator [Chloroflexaceae bacterium]
MKRFGEKLRILRQRRGMSLQELAEVLGFSKTHTHRLEQGQKKPHADLLLQIAEYFEVSLDDLMRDERDV